MKEEHLIIGQEDLFKKLKKGMSKLHSGEGSVFLLDGEAGFGKTNLLAAIDEDCKESVSDIVSVYVETQTPVGSFNVANLQPLLPFTRVVENLLKNRHLSPKKKLAINLGMSVLSMVPFAGDVVRAVKEIGRDWREFKKDESNDESQKKKASSAVTDFHDTLISYASKKPLMILLDDMQWSDSQSIELISYLADNIIELPIMFVIAYRKSVVEAQGLPILTFLNNTKERPPDNLFRLELNALSRDNLNKLSGIFFKNYITNEEFENWIFEKSYGVPGVIVEYLRYFKKYPPFTPDGKLVMNFDDNEFLPASLQSLFSQALDQLNDEEKNLLSICSSEGQEFTALVISKLLNTDILTTIKKLRNLQKNTNIIKSLGAQRRYGVKTTTYRFTQAFYQQYFENSLEYEEYIALHGQIASILKEKFDETDNEDIREEIAPFLAAHSQESGDSKMVQSMLLVSAKQARRTGSEEMAQSAFQDYEMIGESIGSNNEDNPERDKFLEILRNFDEEKAAMLSKVSEQFDEISDKSFQSTRNRVVSFFNAGKYDDAHKYASDYLDTNIKELDSTEQMQILVLAARSAIEMSEFERAEDNLTSAMNLNQLVGSNQVECLILNSMAILRSKQNKNYEAMNLLKKAAELAIELPPELRLITMVNIGILLKEEQPEKSKQYFEAANKMGKSLNLKDISAYIRTIQ